MITRTSSSVCANNANIKAAGATTAKKKTSTTTNKAHANANARAKAVIKSKAGVMSSSPPSSPASWVDNGQDLNKMLAETQRKIHEQHRKLAQKAMGDAKDQLADVRAVANADDNTPASCCTFSLTFQMGKINHAFFVSHKAELNEIAEALVTKLAEQDEIIARLYEDLAVVNGEAQGAFERVMGDFKADVEDAVKVGMESGQGVQKVFNDEKRSLQVLELALGAELNYGETPSTAAAAATTTTTTHPAARRVSDAAQKASTRTRTHHDAVNGDEDENDDRPRSRARKS
ncbi:hypothetical protein I316_04596 [Kwoniella heveanensis BCC8398]|uniref:Uncharacterized protein n=1 Tax=Kwoniella heveanensis BCC8398 TaxID=1296120 RepID=A0A1B9GS41_9TREE|nr:hypothetical protein I316_04596 [Kwoniella heveanensis BCC8398]